MLRSYILILLPIIELVLFIEVGSYIGSFNVILSIVFTIVLGYYLIKQKLRTISFEIFNIKNIHDIYAQYTTSIYSFFAGLLLIIPGYVTDIIGLIILLPFFRPQMSHYFESRYKSTSSKSDKKNIIDGDYRDDE
tara:strand:+ start:10012 stop:10416 length:405 start_codon:yes stop_codon:yes gene_type:complete